MKIIVHAYANLKINSPISPEIPDARLQKFGQKFDIFLNVRIVMLSVFYQRQLLEDLTLNHGQGIILLDFLVIWLLD